MDGIQVTLLGTPGAQFDGQHLKVVGRQRALLAALALRPRTTVSADRLLAVVWGEGARPADPSNALHQRISALRRLVDPNRAGTVLVQQHHGYSLRIDDEQIDACRFVRLADRGRWQLAAADAVGAAQTLAAALAQWRGPALDGCADEPWAVGEARALEEQRLAAIEDRNEALLALGRSSEVVATTTDLLAEHPLRERSCGQLMLALYQGGRQAEALQVYDRTRRRLAEELGVDPGPQLQHTHARVLDQAPELGTPRPPLVRAPSEGNLPARRGSVIGRDDALDRVARLLGHTRLLTLTGPGGAGKTTLALEAARRCKAPVNGIWFVELAPTADGEAVTSVLAATLQLTSGGLSADAVDADHLATVLIGRELLVVLDNCEHVIDAVADLVGHLLTAVAGLRVIATSREPLQVPGEVVWSVPALGLPDEDAVRAEEVGHAPAVQLLIDRVRAHTDDFALSDADAAAAAQVVRRLDGIPLAIELAAARLRVLSLPELAAGLDDRFRIIAGSQRTTPSRHRTLRGALDWSWDLLGEPLQRSWAALSVARGALDADTAALLLDAAGVDAHHLEALTDLVDRSLLIADTASTPTRYRMLESLRDYGMERLDQLGLADEVHQRHLAAVRDALIACHETTSSTDFGVDIDGLGIWLDDARAAMGWAHRHGDHQHVQRLAGLLGWLWLLRGHATEGLVWLDRGLGPVDHVDPSTADPEALLWAAGLRAVSANLEHAASWADLAIDATAGMTPAHRIIARIVTAIQRANSGQAEQGMAILDATARDAEAIGGWPLGFVRLITGQMARITGQLHLAQQQAGEALELLTAANVPWGRAYALNTLIEDAALHGDHPRSRDLALEGLAICKEHRLAELEAGMLIQLGLATHELGDLEQAAAHLERAIALASTVGRTTGLGYAHIGAGILARRRGDLTAAERHLAEAHDILTGTGVGLGILWTDIERTLVAARSGDLDRSAAHGAAALDLAYRIGDPRATILSLEAFAAAVVQSAPEQAVGLLATAAARRRMHDIPTPPPEQRDIDRVSAQARERIDAETYDACWAQAHRRAVERSDDLLLEFVDAQRSAG